jgi:hypothetical protein
VGILSSLDPLMWASLDPQLRSLGSVTIVAAQVSLKVIVVRDDNRFRAGGVEAARPAVCNIAVDGLALIAIGRAGLTPQTVAEAGIRRKLGFANANTAWAYGVRLGIEIRMRILERYEDGPLRLACPITRVRTVGDPVPARLVHSIISTSAAISSRGPSTPRTIAKSRSCRGNASRNCSALEQPRRRTVPHGVMPAFPFLSFATS